MTLFASHKSSRWISIAYYFSWLILFFALLNIIGSYGSRQWDFSTILSSDALYIPRFYRDVLAHGNVADWNLPPNPYFFPDMLLFIPLDILSRLLQSNVYLTVILYTIAQLLLLVIGMILVQKQIFGENRFSQIFTIQVFTLCLILIATTKSYFFTYLFMSSFHVSVLIVLVFATVQMLRIMQPQSTIKVRMRSLLLLFALVFLTSLSDTLFIIQFVVPALVASLAWLKWERMARRRLLQMDILLLLAATAGQWFRLLVVPSDRVLHYTQTINWLKIANSFAFFIQQVREVAIINPLFALLWLSSMLSLIAVLIAAWIRLKRGEEEARSLLMVVLLFLGSITVAAIAAVVTGNLTNEGTFRYILPTLYLPIFVGWPLFLATFLLRSQPEEATDRTSNLVVVGSSIVSMILLAYMIFAVQPATIVAAAQYRSPFVTCLEREVARRNLHAGLANYWQANSTSVLSDGKLEVVTVGSPWFVPTVWLNSHHMYEQPFDYIVMTQRGELSDQIPQDLVTQAFGPPADSFKCEDSKVYVYNRPSDVQIHRWFLNRPEFAQLDQVGDGSEFYGFSLPSWIGGVVIGLSKGASDAWKNGAGILADVPLNALPAGSYVVSFDLYSDSANTGDWEVVTGVPNQSQVLASEPVTNSGTSRLTTHFTLTSASNTDIRVNYSGHGTLFVDKICVQRVDPAQASSALCNAPWPTSSLASTQEPWNLLHPQPNAFLENHAVDFAWQWTGPPLSNDEAFEVRLWKKGDTIHYGAHDAKASRGMVRQIGDTYILRLDLQGAYSVMQHGAGDYEWTVAVVATEPTYRDLQNEAAPRQLSLLP